MTEDEAKTRWCPFTRGDQIARERVDSTGTTVGENGSRCIASSCMAWRVGNPYQENSYQVERPEGDGWQPGSPAPKTTWWWRTIPKSSTGYCGLAGQP